MITTNKHSNSWHFTAINNRICELLRQNYQHEHISIRIRTKRSDNESPNTKEVEVLPTRIRPFNILAN